MIPENRKHLTIKKHCVSVQIYLSETIQALMLCFYILSSEMQALTSALLICGIHIDTFLFFALIYNDRMGAICEGPHLELHKHCILHLGLG